MHCLSSFLFTSLPPLIPARRETLQNNELLFCTVLIPHGNLPAVLFCFCFINVVVVFLFFFSSSLQFLRKIIITSILQIIRVVTFSKYLCQTPPSVFVFLISSLLLVSVIIFYLFFWCVSVFKASSLSILTANL